jgi:hypothetical protein
MERLFMFPTTNCQLHYGNKCINTTRKSLDPQVLSFFRQNPIKLKTICIFYFSSFPAKTATTANILKVSKEFSFYLLFIFFNLRSTRVFNLLIYYFLLQSVSSESFSLCLSNGFGQGENLRKSRARWKTIISEIYEVEKYREDCEDAHQNTENQNVTEKAKN